MEFFENILKILVGYGIILFEFSAIIILLTTCVKGMCEYIKRKNHILLNMAEKMNLALSFKLGAEILRLVTIREMSEIVIIASIVGLHAAISILINWELKRENLNNTNKENNNKDIS